MTNTIWKPVYGYRGLYEVSNTGRVRSLDREIQRGNQKPFTIPGIERKFQEDKDGYYQLGLNKDGVKKSFRVHTLVLEAFLSPRPDGLEGRHIDGNNKNNYLTNITWGTREQNALDARLHGRHKNTVKTHCDRGHELVDPNLTNLREGVRDCLSCTKARSFHNRKTEKERRVKTFADNYYQNLMQESN